jgi:dihydrofolate reductase
LIKEFQAEDIQGLKERSGKDIVLFGSSNLALTFFRHNLIDEVRILINPMFLGGGHTFLTGLDQRLPLRLKDVQRFNSGNVMLIYQPINQKAE